MVTRLFEIKGIASGCVWELDVNCPTQWIGSGVYDVDHPAWQEVRLEVTAPSMEKALEIAQKYESSETPLSVYDVWFLYAEDKGPFEWDKFEIVDVEEGEINWGEWQG